MFLVGMSLSYYLIDEFGETIQLKTAPVDPRDLFYGDYVTLGYEVEQISEENWSGSDRVDAREKVYLILSPNQSGIYEVAEAADHKLEARETNDVVITGWYGWYDRLNGHRIHLGLDRYYIEENTGEEFENSREPMTVTIAVAPWGQKKITDLTRD